MAKWSQEEKLKALAMAEATSIREAAEETGIPEGTIKRWRSESRSEPNPANRTEPSKKIEQLAEEAADQARGEVAAFVAERGKGVAGQLLQLIELSIQEAAETIQAGPGPDEARAQWLRSIIGAIAQGVEKHQLLTGRPTQRQEVVDNPFAGLTTEELRQIVHDPGPVN